MRFTRDEITELQSMIKIARNSIGVRKGELIAAVHWLGTSGG
jgi:hypothetical protein